MAINITGQTSEFFSDSLPGYQALYCTTRNGIVESIHYGAVAVVTADGTLFAWAGDPQARTFMRSSAKPFQCIPLLEMGGKEKFKLSAEEVAVICASHSGTDQHLRTIVNLQRKIGITESDLRCGTHLPVDQASRLILQHQGLSPSQNHHNCSGKHTGMLAQAALLGAAIEKYTEIEHPVQQGILAVFSSICGLDKTDIPLGRDGCSVPTFAVPEAFQSIGVFPNAIRPGSPGLGIALKIAGGDLGKRARRAVTLEILRQLGILMSQELQVLADLGPIQTSRNQAGITTGEARPCFQLQYN